MPINTALMAEETKRTANQMNLPTARAKGTDVATTGGAGSSKSTSTTTSTWTPNGAAPAAPVVPDFQAPEFDEGEVGKLRQRMAGPQVRRLRDVTTQALSANTSENPNVRKMTVRQALQGYGSGLGSILASAQGAAAGQYQARYNQQFQGAQLSYNAQRNMDMQAYSNAWTAFLRSGTTTQKQNQSQSSQTVNADGTTGGQGIKSGPSTIKPAGPDPWSPNPVYDNSGTYRNTGPNWDPFPELKV